MAFSWYVWLVLVLVLVDSCWEKIIQVKIPSTEKVMNSKKKSKISKNSNFILRRRVITSNIIAQ